MSNEFFNAVAKIDPEGAAIKQVGIGNHQFVLEHPGQGADRPRSLFGHRKRVSKAEIVLVMRLGSEGLQSSFHGLVLRKKDAGQWSNLVDAASVVIQERAGFLELQRHGLDPIEPVSFQYAEVIVVLENLLDGFVPVDGCAYDIEGGYRDLHVRMCAAGS